MLSINDLKVNTTFKYQNDPYIVLKAAHLKMGRSAAVLQAKIKNLKNGQTLERNFKPADKFEETNLDKKKADFLYTEGDKSYFMDQNYEQFFIPKDLIAEQLKFLKEGLSINVLYFDDQAIGIELPPKVNLQVIEAPPAVRGDTAQGSVIKLIKLETNYELNAPIFIKQGDTVRVNTDTGEYVERVK